MNVLITGGTGQLGTELRRRAPPAVTVVAPPRGKLDIGDGEAVRRLLAASPPDVVINAAAFTAVDRAESEPDAAARINEAGAAHVAAAAAACGARLVQISTDYVFDGGASVPYTEEQAPNPLSVYGRTKLEGERAVLAACGDRAIIVRTSWVYSLHGSNFFLAMRQRMARAEDLRVVADQVGSPTWAGSLAEAVWAFATRPAIPGGIYHWTDAGVASWYDFAVAIQEECLAVGALPGPVGIRPIRSAEYPTPARRPAFSVLDKGKAWEVLGAVSPHWRVSLRRMLAEEGAHGA